MYIRPLLFIFVLYFVHTNASGDDGIYAEPLYNFTVGHVQNIAITSEGLVAITDSSRNVVIFYDIIKEVQVGELETWTEADTFYGFRYNHPQGIVTCTSCQGWFATGGQSTDIVKFNNLNQWASGFDLVGALNGNYKQICTDKSEQNIFISIHGVPDDTFDGGIQQYDINNYRYKGTYTTPEVASSSSPQSVTVFSSGIVLSATRQTIYGFMKGDYDTVAFSFDAPPNENFDEAALYAHPSKHIFLAAGTRGVYVMNITGHVLASRLTSEQARASGFDGKGNMFVTSGNQILVYKLSNYLWLSEDSGVVPLGSGTYRPTTEPVNSPSTYSPTIAPVNSPSTYSPTIAPVFSSTEQPPILGGIPTTLPVTTTTIPPTLKPVPSVPQTEQPIMTLQPAESPVIQNNLVKIFNCTNGECFLGSNIVVNDLIDFQDTSKVVIKGNLTWDSGVIVMTAGTEFIVKGCANMSGSTINLKEAQVVERVVLMNVSENCVIDTSNMTITTDIPCQRDGVGEQSRNRLWAVFDINTCNEENGEENRSLQYSLIGGVLGFIVILVFVILLLLFLKPKTIFPLRMTKSERTQTAPVQVQSVQGLMKP